MNTGKYIVEVVCRQRVLYEIEAAGADAAERHALQRWQRGDASDVAGLQSCSFEGARVTVELDEIRARQDDEVLLRFIRQREKLQRRWAGSRLDASAADAISASQIASGLGWYRTDIDGENIPDVVRAAQGLERLCARRSLVGFERERVRSHERGSIRLYCTPEYLDRLAEGLDEIPMHRARPA